MERKQGPKLHAVARGRDGPGLYASWAVAHVQTNGVKGSCHKAFSTGAEAEAFLKSQGCHEPAVGRARQNDRSQNTVGGSTARKIRYYAVANGRRQGIYNNWGEAGKQVNGFPGACHKAFDTLQKAQEFIDDYVAEKAVSKGMGGNSDLEGLSGKLEGLCL
ncbi:hypothetical protein VTK73DRAFT_9607 [Phialemonium thermophilum]|uniref:Ribonuclease H1 N-terminal domain-containing protein n=1 Tax=Phialemonium thermophilum TaxID=223376 RepID=A0ABR3W1E0_9PEZI